MNALNLVLVFIVSTSPVESPCESGWLDRNERLGRLSPGDSAMPMRVSSTVGMPNPVAIRVGVDQQSSHVAFDGSNYVVVWQDSSGGSWDVRAARVSPEGAVLDPGGFDVSSATGDQTLPDIASDGARSLVVWHDTRSTQYPYIYGARVSPAGTVLDPQGIVVCNSQQSPNNHPRVGSNGTGFLVSWCDWRYGTFLHVFGARVAQSGAVLDPSGIPVCTTYLWQSYPSVTSDGSNYLVTWMHCPDNSPEEDIYGARVTPAGVCLDPLGLAISTAPDLQQVPAAAFDGTDFLVVWADFRNEVDVYGARVTPGGSVLDPSGIPISTGQDWQNYAAVAYGGGSFLVVWQDLRNGIGDIYGARVTPDGTVLDPAGIPICAEQNGQGSPNIAFDGTNFLVIWEDNRNGATLNIYGARVTPDGVVLDPDGFIIPGSVAVKEPAAGDTIRRPTLIQSLVLGSKPLHAKETVVLRDPSGRVTVKLHPGMNDIRALPPGVYFASAGSERPPWRIVVLK
ncbi:MAG: hypothetical protein NTX53_04515 [candidate division WOR-3 bacterium]|nr:hypothetical protein [candidate division WOR-3 bacterium]